MAARQRATRRRPRHRRPPSTTRLATRQGLRTTMGARHTSTFRPRRPRPRTRSLLRRRVLARAPFKLRHLLHTRRPSEAPRSHRLHTRGSSLTGTRSWRPPASPSRRSRVSSSRISTLRLRTCKRRSLSSRCRRRRRTRTRRLEPRRKTLHTYFTAPSHALSEDEHDARQEATRGSVDGLARGGQRSRAGSQVVKDRVEVAPSENGTAQPHSTVRCSGGARTLHKNDDCMLDLGVKQYDDCDLEYVCCNSGSSPRPRDGTRGADRPLHARSYQLRARTRPAIAMAIARPTLSCRIAFEYSFDEFSGYAVSRYRGTMIPRTGTAPGATRSRSPRHNATTHLMRDQESPQNSST